MNPLLAMFYFDKDKLRSKLEEEAERMNDKYGDCLNVLTIFQNKVVVFRKFDVVGNKVVIYYHTAQNIRTETITCMGAREFDFKFGLHEIEKARMLFLNLKVGLEDFGIEIYKLR